MYVVIFRSTRSLGDEDLYAQWSARMEAAVAQVPGYVSHFGHRDTQTRQGVTISYFETEDAITQWRELGEHREAQQLGRDHFYEEYTVEVARLERSYRWPRQ